MIRHQIGNSKGNYHYNAYIYRHAAWMPHFHGSFELMYVSEGSVSISVNGVPETLNQGELILLCPYTVHSLTVEHGQVWVGVFSEDFVFSYAKKHRHAQYAKFRCDADAEAFLKSHLFFQGQPERFLCISCLYLVCSQCQKHALLHTAGQNTPFIHKVITYVSENISKDLSLQDIAHSMNYEYHYFSALFNRSFSMNFKSFLHLLRIENACALLSDSRYTVTQVSRACGFASIRNFNRVFQKVCHCTPLQYRTAHCGKEIPV